MYYTTSKCHSLIIMNVCCDLRKHLKPFAQVHVIKPVKRISDLNSVSVISQLDGRIRGGGSCILMVRPKANLMPL